MAEVATECAFLKGVGQDASKAVESLIFLLARSPRYYPGVGGSILSKRNWADGVKNVIGTHQQTFSIFRLILVTVGFSRALTPDVQGAITFVGSLKKKLSTSTNPFDKNPNQRGLTSDDVAKAVEAGKAIRAAAQANQLTK